MNFVDLDFKTANLDRARVSLLIGLGFIAVMPPRVAPNADARMPKNSVSCSA